MVWQKKKKRSLRSTGTKESEFQQPCIIFSCLEAEIHSSLTLELSELWHLNLTSQSSISSSVIHSELTWGLHKKICESTAAQCLKPSGHYSVSCCCPGASRRESISEVDQLFALGNWYHEGKWELDILICWKNPKVRIFM